MKYAVLERLVYVCECAKGKAPHIHWDVYTSQPEHLDHVEPAPTKETPVEKPK